MVNDEDAILGLTSTLESQGLGLQASIYLSSVRPIETLQHFFSSISCSYVFNVMFLFYVMMSIRLKIATWMIILRHVMSMDSGAKYYID